MPALLIALCVGTLTVQSIFTKQYSLKGLSGDYTFGACKVLFAFLFFLFTTKDLSITAQILPYSLGFAAAYTAAIAATIFAIKTGPLAISSLILSYSLIIPTMYGFLFRHEPVGLLKCVGIAFLLVSLFLVRNESKGTEEKKVSGKWLFFISVAFVGNGMCSVVQNAQQYRFGGVQNGNFMVAALFISLVALVVLAVIFERKTFLPVLRQGSLYAAAEGLCNGATNLLVMVIIGMVASSVFFPVLSCGQMILIFVISAVFYKERFIPRQIAGLGCGLAALVLLNL